MNDYIKMKKILSTIILNINWWLTSDGHNANLRCSKFVFRKLKRIISNFIEKIIIIIIMYLLSYYFKYF